MTNNHVVEDAEDITVTMENGDKYPAKLIGTDPRTDVALIKVNAEGKTFPYRRVLAARIRASATGCSRSAIRSASAAR